MCDGILKISKDTRLAQAGRVAGCIGPGDHYNANRELSPEVFGEDARARR